MSRRPAIAFKPPRASRGNRRGNPRQHNNLRSFADDDGNRFLGGDSESALAQLAEPTDNGRPGKTFVQLPFACAEPPPLVVPKLKQNAKGGISSLPQNTARSIKESNVMNSTESTIPKRKRPAAACQPEEDVIKVAHKKQKHKLQQKESNDASSDVVDLLDDDLPDTAAGQTRPANSSVDTTPRLQATSPANDHKKENIAHSPFGNCSTTTILSENTPTATSLDGEPNSANSDSETAPSSHDFGSDVEPKQPARRHRSKRDKHQRSSGEATKRAADDCQNEVFQPRDTSQRTDSDGCINVEEEHEETNHHEGGLSFTKVNGTCRSSEKAATSHLTKRDENSGGAWAASRAASRAFSSVARTFGSVFSPKQKRTRASTSIQPGASLTKLKNEHPEKKRKTVQRLTWEHQPRRSGRLQKLKPKVSHEIVEIADTDDEEELPMPSEKTYHAVRISIGEDVQCHDCEAVLKDDGALSIKFRAQKQNKRRKRGGSLKEVEFKAGAAVDLCCHIVVGDAEFDEEACFNFFSFRVSDKEQELGWQLKDIAKSFDAGDPRSVSGLVVVEFRDEGDLTGFLENLRSEKVKELPKEDALVHASVLANASKADTSRRTSFQPRECANEFVTGKNEDEILVVYPFAGNEEKIEQAATSLNELKRCAEKIPSEVAQKDGAKGSNRGHFLTIQVSDYMRLEPEQYLNDTLIDFWMKWISRNDRSDTHFFSTHFYTTLSENGIDGVKSWTEKKGIDVFSKKFVFFPINKTLHWSLAVVVNPGNIMAAAHDELSESDPFPCILFLDSLRAHSKVTVANCIRRWLNHEWKRIKGDDTGPFTKQIMPVFAPKVPYQDNGWDCGVFVCRYAYALYWMRTERFSLYQCEARTGRSRCNLDLLVNEDLFTFNGDDIDRIRKELKHLIENLSGVYKHYRAQVGDKEKEAKMLKKELCEQAESNNSKQCEHDGGRGKNGAKEAQQSGTKRQDADVSDDSSKENMPDPTPTESDSQVACVDSIERGVAEVTLDEGLGTEELPSYDDMADSIPATADAALVEEANSTEACSVDDDRGGSCSTTSPYFRQPNEAGASSSASPQREAGAGKDVSSDEDSVAVVGVRKGEERPRHNPLVHDVEELAGGRPVSLPRKTEVGEIVHVADKGLANTETVKNATVATPQNQNSATKDATESPRASGTEAPQTSKEATPMSPGTPRKLQHSQTSDIATTPSSISKEPPNSCDV